MKTRHKLCLEKTAMNWSIALPPPLPPAVSFFTSSWLPGASPAPSHSSPLGLPHSTDLGPSLPCPPALRLALLAQLLLPPQARC